MTVREATERDYSAIKALHESDGFPYTLPELSNPMWIRRIVIEEGNEIVAAGLGHLSAETFLMLKRASRMRMSRRFLTIQKEAVKAAAECGLPNLHAWVAPLIDAGFGSHLLRNGWSKPLWPAYERKI